MASSYLPHLDLYNFAEVEASDSPYVLTSPRSLRACAKFGIKPMHLLPQTFEEFEEEYSGYDDVYTAFKKHEKDRLKCLHLCREERERIIDELDESNKTSSEDEEENGEEVEKRWHSYGRVGEYEKPDILSFFKAKNEITPRSHTRASLKDYEWNSDEELRTRIARPTILIESDESNEDMISQPLTSEPSQHSLQSQEIITRPVSFSSKNTKRRQTHNLRSNDLSIDSIADQLPKNMRENLSLMSNTDKKLLQTMLSKVSEDEMKMESFSVSATPKQNKNRNIEKYQNRENRLNEVLLRKLRMDHEAQSNAEMDFHIKGERWQHQQIEQLKKKEKEILNKQEKNRIKQDRQHEKLRRLDEENELWNDLDYRDNMKKLERAEIKRNERNRSLQHGNSYQNENIKQKRLEQQTFIEEIEYKHQKASLQFQHLMKEKDKKRSLKSAKERDRRDRQQQQMKSIQQDVEAWQHELKAFQDINVKRAEKKAEKRNTRKSQKAHHKRVQKELDHLDAVERLRQEEEMRREELKTSIAMKDERSKIINNEKQEYKKMSQDAARASRAVRDIIKEKTIKSSFDKMAEEAERVARLEKMGQTPLHPKSLRIKHNSSVVLG